MEEEHKSQNGVWRKRGGNVGKNIIVRCSYFCCSMDTYKSSLRIDNSG